ncbi:hypothetical protein FEP54_05991 [Burkholderia multivorans]|uniref:hypothetical protein n=1 Tax=Burkholderia TaxID=32008 RepID=UPI0009F51D9C|nr:MULTISPECIES: hypothetical protein [Burkholderia]MBJ9685253.1 hypothetical protein [Burkholderia multivorans]MBU9692281.1 hypothetical protein [Burkholderia multivorans]MCO1462219.1 hypothetical protein [Burkholderia multivorans]MDN7743571.1 hypothetical protein [Burkholderia multivorans]MDR8921200.1 hypothetical protein [Burkholderia multivorans]
MANVHCFTSASYSYLDRVRVLGETLKQFHPDWKFWLCLSDTEPEGFRLDLKNESIDGVVHVSELGIPDLKGWMFEHDVIELCTAVKGPMLCKLLEQGADKVVYLDPDIALFSELDYVVELLDSYDSILTPHQVKPDTERRAIVDNEIGSLKYGIYNLGFCAVANTDEGRRFARWWRDRLLDFCFDDVPNGLFTDQRWCDHAPVFFPTLHILRDPGYNVASWNQSQRPLEIHSNGEITADGVPLKFFHFTKITWVGELMLERYAGASFAVFELIKWYKWRLASHAVQGVPKGWWGYSTYSDGSEIPRAHRVLYRSRPDLKARFRDPFEIGGDSFKNYVIEQAL